MTVPRLPKIDYQQKGDLKGYILSSKIMKKIDKCSKEQIEKCFPQKEEMTEFDYEEHKSRLKGKVIHGLSDDIVALQAMDGIELIVHIEKMKTSHYK